MTLTRCRYCEHDNPADAKFCSSCGGALTLPPHLASCARCGTVNPVKASVCCWCGGPLAGRRSLPRPRSRVIVGTAVLAAVAIVGYYTYRQSSYADAPQPSAASRDPAGRPAPAEPVLLEGKAAADAPKSVTADDGTASLGPTTSPFGTAPAEPVRATASQARAGRQPVKSQEAKAGGPGSLGPQACTEAAAALGLCTTKSVQKRERETAAAEAAIKRPATSAAGNAGAPEPGPQTCTEGVAALGLCTPRPTQRRE
jgi:double zinc ribbon protein